MFHAGAFGVHQVTVVSLGGNGDGGGEQIGEGAEIAGPLAGLFGPVRGIEVGLVDRFGVGIRLFGREVGGLVTVGGLHLLVGADADEAIGGGAVDAVGFEPHARFDGGGDVLDRDGSAGGELNTVAADAPVVVELLVADANGGVEIAVV